MKVTDILEEVRPAGMVMEPGSRALGNANFGLLAKAYTKAEPMLTAKLRLDFAPNLSIELDDEDVDAVAKYYDGLPTDAERYDFIYNVMSRYDKFLSTLVKIGRRNPADDPTVQPGLFERKTDLSRQTRSSELNRMLKTAYSQNPSAENDLEAFAYSALQRQNAADNLISKVTDTNRRQDRALKSLDALASTQDQKLKDLDLENDQLAAELEKIEAELSMPRDRVSTAAASKPAKTKTGTSTGAGGILPADQAKVSRAARPKSDKQQKPKTDQLKQYQQQVSKKAKDAITDVVPKILGRRQELAYDPATLRQQANVALRPDTPAPVLLPAAPQTDQEYIDVIDAPRQQKLFVESQNSFAKLLQTLKNIG